MKNGVGYLTEECLKYYFLLSAVGTDLLSYKERHSSFRKLAQIFCIKSDSTAKELFEESEKEHFITVTDVPSYERLCRVIEYAGMSGQDAGLTELDGLILSMKRAAVYAKEEIFGRVGKVTGETVSSTLRDKAMKGSVDAMALLAFMEYNGICVARDAHCAVKRIRLCDRWNSVFGTLMGIAYDENRTPHYYDTLYTVFRDESRKDVFRYVCEAKGYSASPAEDSVSRMIEKAFGLGTVKRSTYDHAFARIALSEILSAADKEKILQTKQKELIQSYSALPFDAKKETPPDFDGGCTDSVAIKRPDELSGIKKNMAVTVRCPSKVYKPLFIVSPDAYMTKSYCDMLKAGLGEKRCVEVDASTLTMRDFVPDGDNNLFLRALSRTKTTQTVFLIKNCSEPEAPVLNELLKMTDHRFRSDFRLSCPAVSMDLSDIKLVFFSASPIEELEAVCDTVRSRRISQEEKKAAARAMFAERSREYGLGRLTVEEQCWDHLAGFDVDRIGSVTDEVIREAVYRGSDRVTLDRLREICAVWDGEKTRGFGFTVGGIGNA